MSTQDRGAALMAAVERDDARGVERLLQGGAPLAWRDAVGRTPLVAATPANHHPLA